MTRASRANKLRHAMGVAVAAVALSGCGVHPGAAVVVGDVRISGDEVDEAAAALCSSTVSGAAAQGQPRPELATRGARQAAVQLLLENELTRQFGESRGIQPNRAQVSAALTQNAQAISVLPESDRAAFRELFTAFQESQSILAEAGRRSLAEQGSTQPAPEEVDAEGARLRQQWAKGLDIEVSPRFGTYEQGALNPTSGSLSIPASERAFQGADAEPGAEWTAGLPASQKC